jgi:hypothetical protein
LETQIEFVAESNATAKGFVPTLKVVVVPVVTSSLETVPAPLLAVQTDFVTGSYATPIGAGPTANVVTVPVPMSILVRLLEFVFATQIELPA